MRVLVACEFSGIVRDAFIKAGHDAISCDVTDTERSGPHIIGDVRDVDFSAFDLMIAHPPCTYVANSGRRWINNESKRMKQLDAIVFVRYLMDVPVRKICIENPVGILSTVIRKPDQIIQPWQFGHPENKRTCLWLKNLAELTPTNILPKHRRESVVYREHDTLGESRATARSRFYVGIATAMAQQWGNDDGKKTEPDITG